MEAIKITNTELNELLTPQVKESTVLSNEAKKVLAVILKYFLESNRAQSEGYLVCPNSLLRESCEMSSETMFSALTELQYCNLIVRKAGQSRQNGKRPTATEYCVKWENLTKKITKQTPLQFLLTRCGKIAETSMSTPSTNSNTKTNTNSNYNTNPKPNYNNWTMANTEAVSNNEPSHNNISKPNNGYNNGPRANNEADLDKIFLTEDLPF